MFYKLIHPFIITLQRNPLLWGMVLLFILPPIGILILIGAGISYIIIKIKRKETIKRDSFTYFFILLIIASLGASINHWSYLYVPIELLGYLGVYHLSIEKMSSTENKFFFWIMICGGIYIYVFDKIHQGLNALGLKLGYVGYLTGGVLLGDKPTTRLYGSTYNPNFATYLLLFSFAFLSAYLIGLCKNKRANQALLYLPFLVVLFMAIVDTGSRAGFIAILVLVLLIIYKFNWRYLPFILTGILTNIGTIFHYMPRHSLIDFSFNYRLNIWLTAIKIFIDHPIFGVTPAGFNPAFYKLDHIHIQHAHDIFLAFFSEYGLIGGIAFIYVFIQVTKKWGKLVFHNKTAWTVNIFTFSLPIIILTGIVDHPLYSPQMALPTIIFLGIFHNYLAHCKKEDRYC